MHESFNENELTELLRFEYTLEQEANTAVQEERERERLFAAQILTEGMPIGSIIEKLEAQPDSSLIGIQLQLGREIDDFIADHPSVTDEHAPFSMHDMTVAKMLIEYGHCKILAQLESAYAMHMEAPSYPDLLKEVQFEIITTNQLTAESKTQWNEIAVRYIPGEPIDMTHPEQDAFVIAKRQEHERTAASTENLVQQRQLIYDLLYQNGDAFGLRNHDDDQQFITKIATSILYENSEFAEFHLRTVYDLGKRIGLTTEEVTTVYEWTRAQVRRT